MKLSIPPAAIIALLKDHPEVQIEITKKAASQIATAFERNALRSRVEDHLQALLGQDGWFKGRPNKRIQDIFKDEATKAIREAFPVAFGTEVTTVAKDEVVAARDVIVERLEGMVAYRIEAAFQKQEAYLKGRIDALIAERISAALSMLGGKE